MKKFLMGITTVVLLTVAGCEDGSFLSSTPAMKSDKVGRLEATGLDLRVYEFTPQSDLKKQCVFVAGDNKAGLECWTK